MHHWFQVNCETDFVSRNNKFRELVAKSTTACLEEGKKSMAAKVSISQNIHMTTQSLEKIQEICYELKGSDFHLVDLCKIVPSVCFV